MDGAFSLIWWVRVNLNFAQTKVHFNFYKFNFAFPNSTGPGKIEIKLKEGTNQLSAGRNVQLGHFLANY